LKTVSDEAFITGAFKRSIRVYTVAVDGTIVRSGRAFVFIPTEQSGSTVTVITSTGVATFRVFACRMSVAIVSSKNALVNVRTVEAVALEAVEALAAERAWRVEAFCSKRARFLETFVDIRTGCSVSSVTFVTSAGEAANCVLARSVYRASMTSSLALIDVLARLAVAGEARIARTSKAAFVVEASCVLVASVGVVALIDIGAGSSVA